MIFVVIGQAGAGKTSFVKRQFLQGEAEVVEDIVSYTTNGKYYAMGKYNVGIRCEGTDTLSYSAGKDIRRQVEKLVMQGKNIVLEGDRINNAAMMKFLMRYSEHVQLIFLYCSIKESMRRLRAAGSSITPSFVKATKTKSKNNFLKYREYFRGRAINTEAKEIGRETTD